MDHPEKNTTCALRSLSLLTYTTKEKTFHAGPEGPSLNALGLTALMPNGQGFFWGIKAMEISMSQMDKTFIFKIPDLNYWAPTLNLTMWLLTAVCVTRFSSRGHMFHAISHHQVSSQEKYLAKQYLTQTKL